MSESDRPLLERGTELTTGGKMRGWNPEVMQALSTLAVAEALHRLADVIASRSPRP